RKRPSRAQAVHIRTYASWAAAASPATRTSTDRMRPPGRDSTNRRRRSSCICARRVTRFACCRSPLLSRCRRGPTAASASICGTQTRCTRKAGARAIATRAACRGSRRIRGRRRPATRMPRRPLTANLYACPPDASTIATDTDGDWQYRGVLQVGALATSGDDDNAMWARYVDWDGGLVLGLLDLAFERARDGSYANLRASRL